MSLKFNLLLVVLKSFGGYWDLAEGFTVWNYLGTPVVPFYPLYFGVSFFKLNMRKKGTLSIMWFLGNPVIKQFGGWSAGFRFQSLGV